MRRSYAKLRLAIILIITALVGILVFKLATASTIIVVLDPAVSPIDTVVTVDGKAMTPRGTGGQEYVGSVGFGSHKISVVSPGYISQEVSASTTLRSTKKLNITLETISAEAVAKEIVKDTNGFEITNPKFFGKNDWIAFIVGDGTGQTDGLLVVAQFDAVENSWEVVFEGTDGSTSVLSERNAPIELINYLENGNL